jgi:hypothetical protein
MTTPMFSSLSQLRRAFNRLGCHYLFVKKLAPRQDNEKNQIFLGSDESLLNQWPGTIQARSASTSRRKRWSNPRASKLESLLDLVWVWPGGTLAPAPHARLINYFQYPEVRLSGFMRACAQPPEALRRSRLSHFGTRYLVVGFAGKTTYATIVESKTFRDHHALRRLCDRSMTVLTQLRTMRGRLGDGRTRLVREVKSLSGTWHPSVSLGPRDRHPRAFHGPQGPGYTLEALLGIPRNSDRASDKFDHEIKAVTGGRVTIITTEPDSGYRVRPGFREFMRSYGTPGRKGDGSRRFGGIFRTPVKHSRRGVCLRVKGWDLDTARPSGDRPVSIQLWDPRRRRVVSSWSLEKLALSWTKKHANAIYVQCTRRKSVRRATESEYRYGPQVIVCSKTDVFRFIDAVARGIIFFDPADVVRKDGSSTRRSQWRVTGGSIPRLAMQLGSLYRSVEVATL